jgi:DNA-binding ferritin-like protein
MVGDDNKQFPENFKSEIDKSENYKTRERRIWDLSLLFLEGRQWVSWDNSIQGYASTIRSVPNWKITVNLLLNIYRNLLSKLATTYPSAVVTPATATTDDILKAQASEIAIKYYWNRDKMKSLLQNAFAWQLTCGTVGLHSFYDSDEQRVKTEVISPFDLIFEAYVLSPEDSNWIAIRKHVNKDVLTQSYPEHAKMIEEASDGLTATSRPGDASTADIPIDRLQTFEIYWKDGKHAVLLDDTYLYEGKNPLTRIPIEVMRYTELPGRLWGIGLVSPLIDMQWLYNKSRSQVIQNIELMANPKWLIPKSCGVSPQAITNRAGEKVYYNAAGGVPTQVGATPLPAHVFDNITRLQSEMMDVSGIHSTSLGKRAVGVTSGKAMQTLAEQDMSQLQNTQLRIEDHVTRLAENVLQLMKVFYKESRMIRTLDSVGELVFKELKNTDIVDNAEVFIEANSLFRSELQDKDAKIYDMLELGLIPPEIALKELSFRTGNKFVVEKMEAMAHAQELLEATIQGFNIEIFRTDDLSSFKEVFGSYMRSSEYYHLDEERQEYIRDVFLAIENATLDPQQLAEANIMDQVFPPKVGPNVEVHDQLASVMGQGSGRAQTQSLEEVTESLRTGGGFDAAEAILSRRNEALMSPKSPGGLG